MKLNQTRLHFIFASFLRERIDSFSSISPTKLKSKYCIKSFHSIVTAVPGNKQKEAACQNPIFAYLRSSIGTPETTFWAAAPLESLRLFALHHSWLYAQDVFSNFLKFVASLVFYFNPGNSTNRRVPNLDELSNRIHCSISFCDTILQEARV